LEPGFLSGPQTRRWNPKMKRFIFAERGGIYIIDLQQTLERLEEAHNFVRNLAERGGSVLFVGTKKQAQDAVEEQTKRVGMPFVNHRGLGGLRTTWRTRPARGSAGSDDANRSCIVIVRVIGDGSAAGKARVTPAEMEAPKAEEPEERPPEEVAEAPEYEKTSPGETVEEPAPEGEPVTEAV